MRAHCTAFARHAARPRKEGPGYDTGTRKFEAKGNGQYDCKINTNSVCNLTIYNESLHTLDTVLQLSRDASSSLEIRLPSTVRTVWTLASKDAPGRLGHPSMCYNFIM